MDRRTEAERELLHIFKTSATKYEANERARPVLEQLSRDPSFLSGILEAYLSSPGSLDRQNYPVVGIPIALNPWFGLVANCWIPLPGRETHIATKAIHHHGDMLLSTVTLFGPGYEHWMFTMPKALDEKAGIYSMDLLESAPHPQHHVAFVDAWIAHTPLYPKSLSITLALWSSRHPVTWRDRAKRLPMFKGRETQLRNLAVKLGLRKKLDLKVVESFDYYPVDKGFAVMKERKEFELGPMEDHICSVFHIVQETGNERLSRTVRRAISDGKVKASARSAVERVLEKLEKGTPIEGRLSEGHYGLPYANFTRDDIKRALATIETAGKVRHDGRQLAS
ncbi:MAG: hypothetical protein JST00_28235 [Deltaproteobacteria bacterium]|nr:hypothetical protein [Deltaproteobacteria bacterium]